MRRWRPVVASDERVILCTHCGSENPPLSTSCERCGKALTIYIGPARGKSYSLGSIMIFIGALSVGLAVCRANVVLGVVTLVLVLPAIGRTLYYSEQERSWSTPMHPFDVIGMFVGSLLLIALQIVFVCMVFGVSTALISSLMPAPKGLIVATVLAAGIALAAGGWLASKTLPRKSSF